MAKLMVMIETRKATCAKTKTLKVSTSVMDFITYFVSLERTHQI